MEDRKLSKKEIRERWYQIAKWQGRLEGIKEQKPIRVKSSQGSFVVEPLNPLYEITRYLGDYEEI
jgi:hypothetical protein